MDRVVRFLNECGAFFVATSEGDQPRVRPFGAVAEFEGRIYFCTANGKKVYAQMRKNPKVEICGMTPDRRWMRLTGQAVFVDNAGAKAAMFQAWPGLANIYQTPDNPSFAVFYLDGAEAVVENMSGQPTERIKL